MYNQTNSDDFFELASDIMCLFDFEGRFLRVNPAFIGVIERDAASLLKISLFDCVHPDEREALRVVFKHLAEGEASACFQSQLVSQAPKIIWLDWQLTVINGAYLYGTARNITPNKLYEEEITEFTHELLNVLNRIDDGFFAFDSHWRYIYINQVALNLLDTTRENLLGQRVHDIFPHLVETSYFRRFEEAMFTQQSIVFADYSPRTKLWYEVSVYPSKSGVSIFYRDVTLRQEAKRMQTELSRQQELTALKERFISVVSHEFRTPLSIISLNNQIIQRYYDKIEPSKVLTYLERSNEQVHHLTDLMNDIVTLNRTMHLSPSDIDIETINIAELAQQVVDKTQTIDQDKHPIRLENTADIQTLRTNKPFLEHMLMNLLSNAVKFSREGSPINLTLSNSDYALTFAISDRGIGIPSDEIVRVSEPFFRARNVENALGTGVGLAIVKNYADLLGAKLRIESKEGDGTTAMILFPLHKI